MMLDRVLICAVPVTVSEEVVSRAGPPAPLRRGEQETATGLKTVENKTNMAENLLFSAQDSNMYKQLGLFEKQVP